MATTKHTHLPFYFLLLHLLIATLITPGLVAEEMVHRQVSHNPPINKQYQEANNGDLVRWRKTNSRRLMIGSTAPICTYNECRGCKYRCRAEQIPVDANDPMNSAYHYRCVCHR